MIPKGPYDLTLNAAEGVLQIVLSEGEQLLASEEWHWETHATEILAPALKELCALFGVAATDFRHIACVAGPGSFTGIRLILATASGLARIGQSSLCGLNYLEVWAHEVWLNPLFPKGSSLYVATRARRNLFHVQKFFLGETVCAASELALLSIEELAQRRAPTEYLFGSCLAEYAPLLGKERLISSQKAPSAQTLLHCARAATYERSDITPLYVRSCDAEENLERLAKRQGLSGSQAQKIYRDLLSRKPTNSL